MGDFWIVDSQISGAIGLDSSAGRKPEEFKPHGLTYKDMRPGAYDPKARLEDMDIDGVDAEVLYFGGPVTQYAERSRAAPLRRRSATTTGCSSCRRRRPTRLIGLAHVPLVDSTRACAELKRIAKMGLQGLPRRSVSRTSAAASRCGIRPTSRSGR